MSYREEWPVTQREIIMWHALRGPEGSPPDNDRTVLVTAKNDAGDRWVDMAAYEHGDWLAGDDLIKGQVLAWADLPAPFKD